MSKNKTIIIFFLLTLLSLASCSPSDIGQKGLATGALGTEKKEMATLTVFLQLADNRGKSLWMRLDSIAITGNSGTYLIQQEPMELQSDDIRKGQVFLCRQALPVGRYQKLRFSIAKAASLAEGKRMMLALDKPVFELQLPGELSLRKGDSLSLFLKWNTTKSMQGTALFAPVFSAAIQEIPLVKDLAYVSCPDIDTLYVIRTDVNQVCGSFGIFGTPTSLSVFPDQNRLYVLSRENATIHVMELSSNRVVDEIKIPLMRHPDKMVVSPDGDRAYVIESKRDLMVQVDLERGGLAGRTTLSGKRPHFLSYLADQKMLAVSAEYDQKITLIDPNSMKEIHYIGAGNGAEGLLEFANSLYVAERKANTVSAYSLPTGVKQGSLTVGTGPVRLAASRNGKYIFSSSKDAGKITILRPGQYNIIKEVNVGGYPRNMAFDRQRKWLYVTDEKAGGVTVVDLSTQRVVRNIILGATPDELVTLQ
jgi:YVTN family beta-propeller protein